MASSRMNTRRRCSCALNPTLTYPRVRPSHSPATPPTIEEMCFKPYANTCADARPSHPSLLPPSCRTSSPHRLLLNRMPLSPSLPCLPTHSIFCGCVSILTLLRTPRLHDAGPHATFPLSNATHSHLLLLSIMTLGRTGGGGTGRFWMIIQSGRVYTQSKPSALASSVGMRFRISSARLADSSYARQVQDVWLGLHHGGRLGVVQC